MNVDLKDEEYNLEVERLKNNIRYMRYFVMSHTLFKCQHDEYLSNNVINSINQMTFVYENEKIDYPFIYQKTTDITISLKRSLEAAKDYRNQKVAVLDFASSKYPGGAPFSAGAQEESICRISTLLPCLEASSSKFHKLHKESHLSYLYNDDLIYIPNIITFKSDEDVPKMLDKNDYYPIDIIVSAAPNLEDDELDNDALYKLLKSRIEKIFQIAQKQEVEVLILGAFGCGAFHNPPEVVAKVFKDLLSQYYFKKVEFAIYCRDDVKKNYHIFKDVLYNNKE